jgi:hypothetical protein
MDAGATPQIDIFYAATGALRQRQTNLNTTQPYIT